MARQNLTAGITSAISFIIFYSILHWHLAVSLLLALGIFIGIYLITKPVQKIGDIEIENIQDGMTLHALYAGALSDWLDFQESFERLDDSPVKQTASILHQTGRDILNYLEKNPRELSKSRHFLEYYFETARKIMVNYSQLQQANISPNKFQHITEKTMESLELLQKIFANQRDDYHEDKVTALEVETDILEKTIKLSGSEL